MKLTDIQPLDKWIEIENSVFDKYKIQSVVFDKDGTRITDNVKWANGICPQIKSNKKGATYICSLAHSNMATMAQKTRYQSLRNVMLGC